MVHGSWLMINLIDMAYEKKYNKSNWGKKEPPKSYKEKRGKLSPLMTEEDKHQASIHELSYDFACRITRLYQYLTDPVQGSGFKVNDDNEDYHEREYIMSKQVYRSGTSVGANVRESKHAQSDADFLSKMSIAYKEADESNYWLNLLHDNGYLNDDQHESLSHDCTRIIKILTSIVKTMRQKLGKDNHEPLIVNH